MICHSISAHWVASERLALNGVNAGMVDGVGIEPTTGYTLTVLLTGNHLLERIQSHRYCWSQVTPATFARLATLILCAVRFSMAEIILGETNASWARRRM